MVAVSLLLPTKDRPDRLERAVAGIREEVKLVQERWRNLGFGNRPCVMCNKVATEKHQACEEHFVAARAVFNQRQRCVSP